MRLLKGDFPQLGAQPATTWFRQTPGYRSSSGRGSHLTRGPDYRMCDPDVNRTGRSNWPGEYCGKRFGKNSGKNLSESSGTCMI
jgi:hypothetical protein